MSGELEPSQRPSRAGLSGRKRERRRQRVISGANREGSKESGANTKLRSARAESPGRVDGEKIEGKGRKGKNEPRTRQARRLYDSLGAVSRVRSPAPSLLSLSFLFPSHRRVRATPASLASDPSTLAGVSPLPLLSPSLATPLVFPPSLPARRVPPFPPVAVAAAAAVAAFAPAPFLLNAPSSVRLHPSARA